MLFEKSGKTESSHNQDILDWVDVVPHEGSMYFRSGGFQDFTHAVDELAGKLTKFKKNKVVLDQFRLGECHFRASHTLKFHQTKKCSIYKEMSHLAFWIAKLKPLRFESPKSIIDLGQIEGFKQFFVGPWSDLENEAKKIDKDFEKILSFPLNESLAVTILLDCIEASQKGHAFGLDNDIDKQNFRNFITLNKTKRPWFHDKLKNSLRNHNYSIRGLAVLVESTLKSPYESQFDMEKILDE